MGVTEKIHNGKTVTYIDFRDCKTEPEMIARFDEAVAHILKGGVAVLTLNNFIGVSEIVSNKFMQHAREAAPSYIHLVKRKTVVGATGIRKIFNNTYNAIVGIKSRAFDTEEEAFEYLTAENV